MFSTSLLRVHCVRTLLSSFYFPTQSVRAIGNSMLAAALVVLSYFVHAEAQTTRYLKCLFAFSFIVLFCSVGTDAQELPFKRVGGKGRRPLFVAGSSDRKGFSSLWAEEDGTVYGRNLSPREAHEWSLGRGEDGWLLYKGKPDEEGRFARKSDGYLCYPLKGVPEEGGEAGKFAEPVLKLSQSLEANCYWEVFDVHSNFEFQAKATCGDYQGWHLSVGPKVDEKQRTITVVRESTKSRSNLYISSP